MPSSNYQLPQLFSRNITKFGIKLSNAAISDSSIIGTNTVLSTLQIHSILTLLLVSGAKGRSAVELMTLLFPEWCNYNSILKNYRTIFDLLFNAPGGDLMKTRKVITFNLNKNVNMEFVKTATEFFYTELIIMRNPTSFIVPVPHIPFHGHGLPLRQPPYLIPSNAAQQPRPLAANSGQFPLRSYSVISSGSSKIYQFNRLASSFNVPNPRKVITMNNTNYNPGCFLNVYTEISTICKFPTNIKNSMVMENRKYYETPNKQYDVKMLIFNGKFKYGTLGIVGDIIEIPLENNNYSLLILKPCRWGLNTLQSFMDYEYFRDVKTHMIYKDMHVEMPIFNVRTNTVLNSSLHQIGLQTIFTTGLDLANVFDNAIPAGYNGSLPMPPPSHDVINNFLVTQKIDFEIDASGVPYLQNEYDNNNLNTDQNVDNKNDINDVNNSASGVNDDVHNFNIDHPFLFFLRWNVLNVPIVIGTIETPIL